MPSNPKLTDTTSQTVFPISRPNNNEVIFTFDTDPSRPGITQLTLPRGSTWAPFPHWHEIHTEYVRVLKGRVKVVLDGVSMIVTSEDGTQTINKFVVHEWMRADHDSYDKDDDEVIVEEWTDPADGSKQVFFRNLLGVFGDIKPYWRSWTPLQIFLICSEYDNYDVMLPAFAPKIVTYWVTHSMLLGVRLAARVIGLSPWYEEYTPSKLREVAASSAHKAKTAKNK